jgi:hypothetical protein
LLEYLLKMPQIKKNYLPWRFSMVLVYRYFNHPSFAMMTEIKLLSYFFKKQRSCTLIIRIAPLFDENGDDYRLSIF